MIIIVSDKNSPDGDMPENEKRSQDLKQIARYYKKLIERRNIKVYTSINDVPELREDGRETVQEPELDLDLKS